MPGELIIHIGTEKTGTTSFQQFCSDHWRLLAQLGVNYPKPPGLFEANNHTYFAAGYQPEIIWPSYRPNAWQTKAAALRELGRILESGGHEKTLLSSEIFSAMFSDAKIEQLAKDVSGYQPKIVVVLRDHYSLVNSSYALRVRGGATYTLAQYVDTLCDPSGLASPNREFHYRYCRYRVMIGAWERIFGRQNVRILQYRQGKTIDVLLSEILKAPISISRLLPYSHNTSLPAEVVEYLRQSNTTFPTLDDLRRTGRLADWNEFQARRRRFAWLASRLDPGDLPGVGSLVTDVQRRQIDQLAADDADWLAERGIVLTAPEASEIGETGEIGKTGREARTSSANSANSASSAKSASSANSASSAKSASSANSASSAKSAKEGRPGKPGLSRTERALAREFYRMVRSVEDLRAPEQIASHPFFEDWPGSPALRQALAGQETKPPGLLRAASRGVEILANIPGALVMFFKFLALAREHKKRLGRA